MRWVFVLWLWVVGLCAPLVVDAVEPAGPPVDAQGHSLDARIEQETALRNLEAMDAVVEDGTYAGDVAWVQEYITRWVATNPKYPPNQVVAERAPELAKIIVDVSRELDVDYRVATVIIRAESGFREGALKGKSDKRDHGVMQVNGGTAETTEGQIREGLTVWTGCRAGCGSLERTITCYSIGRCQFPKREEVADEKTWQRLEFKQRGIVYRMKLFEKAGLTKNRRFTTLAINP
jgi:hypothetical protein